MEEIKVNDFVRTKKGYIGKVIRFDVDNNLHCDNIISTMCGENFRWLNKLEQKEQITKHSPKIIDLIEVRRLREWKPNSKRYWRIRLLRPCSMLLCYIKRTC